MLKYITEFLATFTLICAIGFGQNIFITVATVAILVVVALPISGCHINPAVSLGMCLRRHISKEQAAFYILVQMLAAQLAAEVVFILRGQMFLVQPGSHIPWFLALVSEIITTSLLVALIFGLVHIQGVRQKLRKTPLSSVQVAVIFASFIFVAVSITSPISGAALNPAVGLASFSSTFFHQGWNANEVLLPVWLLYFIGPLMGAIVASVVTHHIKNA